MISIRRIAVGAAFAAFVPVALSAQVFNGGLPAGYVCTGVCGVTGPNGVVTAAPGGGTSFGYVTTAGSTSETNPLGISGTRNGSTLLSGPFTATAGQPLSFAFNYVTSDGAGFADYAFVRLLGGESPLTLFTARTTTSGNTVPGFGLPGLAPGVALAPPSTPIHAGAPLFSGLGSSSNTCYNSPTSGCGFTDWVIATYLVPTAGTYNIQFGVFNFTDTAFDSALAFDFSTGAGGTPIVTPTPPGPITTPEPGSMILLATGLMGVAAMGRRRLR